MDFQIRNATLDDMPFVLELIQELATFEKEPKAVEVNEEDLKRDFKENLFDCLIAENDQNGIMGIALFYNRYSTWKGKTIHLEDLIVKQQFRSLGVGKKLLDQVISIAKKEKLRRVEWVVLDWNKDAVNFYKKVGADVSENWYIVQLDEQGVINYS